VRSWEHTGAHTEGGCVVEAVYDLLASAGDGAGRGPCERRVPGLHCAAARPGVTTRELPVAGLAPPHAPAPRGGQPQSGYSHHVYHSLSPTHRSFTGNSYPQRSGRGVASPEPLANATPAPRMHSRRQSPYDSHQQRPSGQ